MKRRSKLDPFKTLISGCWNGILTAPRRLERSKAIRAKGPFGAPPAFLTLAFAPGEGAQVDWDCGGSIQLATHRRPLLLCRGARLQPFSWMIVALDRQLEYLRLPFIREHATALATRAASEERSHIDYLAKLINGEAALRADRATLRRIKNARFRVIKTLESFRFDWPKKTNRLQSRTSSVCSSSRTKPASFSSASWALASLTSASALGYAACQRGYKVLFANAIDVINTLGRPAQRYPHDPMRKYLTPGLDTPDRQPSHRTRRTHQDGSRIVLRSGPELN